MSASNLANISAVLSVLFLDPIMAQYRRDAILPNLLECEYQSDGTAHWSVKFAARNTADAKAEGYTVQTSDFSTDTKVNASLAWAHYEAYASVTGTASRIQAGNASQAVGPSLIDSELMDAAQELAVKLSTHTYSGQVGASPTQLSGLAEAVDSTGTYAGLAQGTYADWASGENSGALASLDLNMLRTKLLRPYRDNVGKNPNLVLTTGAILDQIQALFDAKSLIMVQSVQGAGDLGKIDIAALGFRGVMVDGVPFIEDRHCTAGTLYAIDPNMLKYRQVPPSWAAMDPMQIQGLIKDLTGQVIAYDDIRALMQRASKRLSGQVNALAKVGDSTSLQIVLDAQLVLKRRNAASKLTLS